MIVTRCEGIGSAPLNFIDGEFHEQDYPKTRAIA